MSSGSLTPRPEPGEDGPAPGLDVHATAALDRLTRWAAKGLRAEVALITLVEGDDAIVTSVTDAGAAQASVRLRAFGAQIVSTAQPLAIGDVRSERWSLGVDGTDDGAVALLGSPLPDRDGHAVGSFCVMDTRRRRWTVDDIELISELTSSATTELELHAARAETERERRWSDRQEGVLELIAAQAPLSRTLSELLSAAELHAPGMLAAITRFVPVKGGTDKLRVIAGHGLPRGFTDTLDGVAVVEGSSISGTAAARREPVIVPDITASDLTPWFVELATSHGLRAGWSTPILTRGGIALGTFTMYFRAPRMPDDRDRIVIDRSVHLARLAIEQVEGAEALRRSVTRAQSLAREQTALQRVATRVARETDPATLFSLVAEQVGRLLKADAGYVLRFEDDDHCRNMGSWARDEQRLLPIDAVTTRDALGFVPRIAAPVLVDGRAWGMVLALRDASGFRREDEKRLVRFAQLAAVAVANAQAHEALATQARTDPLTGLANRRAFDERLAEETERANRHRRALSLMLVDVDHFKTINDRFGHATGDRVLVNVAESVRSVMRSGDLLARIGGDEIAMILPDCQPEQAALVAQRMLDAISSDSALARDHGVTVSAGVAGLVTGQSADDLLRHADQALYGAKDGGRGQVVSYHSDMSARTGLRLSV